MVGETWLQSQVTSYQRLLKWYLILPCLKLRNIRYVSRIKWSYPVKRVAPPLHLGVVAIEKGAFLSPSTTVTNFTYIFKTVIYHFKCFATLNLINYSRSHFSLFGHGGAAPVGCLEQKWIDRAHLIPCL